MINLNPVSWVSKLFDNKKFLITFSVVCAIIFWLVIDITENPSRDITFNEVSVVVADQADDNDRPLIPVEVSADSVSVTVNGPGYIVGTVSKDDITVSVKSYAEVSKPGTYVLTLTASVAKNDCEVVSISPSYIQVVYDYNTVTEVPVEIDVSGYEQYLSEGCEIDTSKSKLRRDDSVGTEITSLSVKGPSEIISTISKVVAKPIITGTEVPSESHNFDVALIFYDALGNVIDSNSLQYNTEHYLRIIVFKRAIVNIVPTFTNLPACYAESTSGMPKFILYREQVSRAKTKVSQIEVKGPADKVDLLINEGIKLAPIDFSQINSNDVSFLRSFILDEGVEIVDGTEEIIVVLDFGGQLTSKEFSVTADKIKLLNTGDKNWAIKYTGTLRITLCGNSKDIKKIKASDLTLTVDCAENSEEKAITVSVNAKYRAWMTSINKARVEVVIV